MNTSTEYQHGHTFIGGLNHVYHCNHYNAHLQMAILLTEGIESGFDPRQLLHESAAILVRELRNRGYSRSDLEREFTHCGFGIIRQNAENIIETPNSHYGQATYLLGQAEKGCFFNAGFIEGMTGRVTKESSCRHQGAESDIFTLSQEAPNLPNPFREPSSFTPVPERFQFEGCETSSAMVDEERIIAAVKTLPLYGRTQADSGDGLIPVFGVVLTNHYADYYNLVSYETHRRMIKIGFPEDLAASVFEQCGHVCAFNTFGGIMESPEFYGLIVPMCQNLEDWIHGMIAVINALGWGIWRVERIVPGQELVIRIYNSYEGVGYRRLYPKADTRSLSFMAMGAVRGLAHLFWKIDIRDRPVLNEEFYIGVFNNPYGQWSVEQTHSIAAGNGYDRIVAWR